MPGAFNAAVTTINTRAPFQVACFVLNAQICPRRPNLSSTPNTPCCRLRPSTVGAPTRHPHSTAMDVGAPALPPPQPPPPPPDAPAADADADDVELSDDGCGGGGGGGDGGGTVDAADPGALVTE
ncbi:hypothetical protein BU14_0401s0004 [Porphyra umbilicalis]|uniref:Uncharacterized protein n=1 Tax=Porphyra umbilicalis TaxID=2786 RepID=A0A1X6NWR8_PORUM|nr:hypothetical protein BU14_0401s0004 [Porphyra umbilicalis]|eukprot:OSX72833.1 hypothetical protein BU14_0401s0004 [Porphyra umbilicalis]